MNLNYSILVFGLSPNLLREVRWTYLKFSILTNEYLPGEKGYRQTITISISSPWNIRCFLVYLPSLLRWEGDVDRKLRSSNLGWRVSRQECVRTGHQSCPRMGSLFPGPYGRIPWEFSEKEKGKSINVWSNLSHLFKEIPATLLFFLLPNKGSIDRFGSLHENHSHSIYL